MTVRLYCERDPGDSKSAVHHLCRKFDHITSVDLVEHCQILDLKHHGHRRHVEVLERVVADSEVFSVLVNFAHFPVAQCGGTLRLCCVVRRMIGARLLRNGREGNSKECCHNQG
jgi:hypothetical protein